MTDKNKQNTRIHKTGFYGLPRLTIEYLIDEYEEQSKQAKPSD
ncbi:MAG: hypothetical protein R3224_07850 [Balneolaceae bacterium]|nr:hypothetical protein [Balneolaceae bacterium]